MGTLYRIILILCITVNLVLGKNTCGNGRCICYTNAEGLVMDCSAKGISKIAEIKKNIPAKVIKLDLSNNTLTGLKNNTFGHAFKYLRVLLLQNNKISSVQKLAFEDLSHTVLINMANNRLDNAPAVIPPNVEELDISSNHIFQLKNFSFMEGKYTESNLKKLHLQENGLVRVEEFAFGGLTNLAFLNLSNNNISFMSRFERVPTIFRPLAQLKELYIQRNGVPSSKYEYPDDILGDLKSLVSLTIDGINNKPFGPGFEKLTKLSSLILSGFQTSCSIESLKNNTFVFLTSVKYLDVSNCKLSHIEAAAFAPLANLEILDLSYNERLEYNYLPNVLYGVRNTNVKTLNYSYNFPLRTLASELKIEHLRYFNETIINNMYLDFNSMGLLETGAFYYFPRTLKVLSVNGNSLMIGEYDLQFKSLISMEELYMNEQYKSLKLELPDRMLFSTRRSRRATSTCIDTELLWPKRLKKFFFINCKEEATIPCIKVPSNNVMEEISVATNIFYSWQGPLKGFHSLKKFDLSRNYCSNVSDVFFSDMPNLQQLVLHTNFIGLMPMAKIEHLFKYLTNLKVFDLSLNVITQLPERIFDNMMHLEHLNLSANGLASFNVDLSKLDHLKYLDLSVNSLGFLTKSVRSYLEKRMKCNLTVNLAYNPISCTCENMDFVYWLLDHKNNFIGFEKYTFVDKNNKPIAYDKLNDTVTDMKKNCQSNVGALIFSAVSCLVLVSILAGCVLYRYRWKLRYLYYMSKAKYRGYSVLNDMDARSAYKYDAFISYADEELRFIRKELLPELEDTQDLILCIHQRDFTAGNAVAENIVDAITNSRKTVLIISKNFLKSWWCMYEFRMAQMEDNYTREGKNSLVVVMFEKVPHNLIPLDLLRLIQSLTYIEYPDDPQERELFWKQVKEAIEQ